MNCRQKIYLAAAAVFAHFALVPPVLAEHAIESSPTVAIAATSTASDELFAYLWLQVPKLEHRMADLQKEADTASDKNRFDALKKEFNEIFLEAKSVLRVLNKRFVNGGKLEIDDGLAISRSETENALANIRELKAKMKALDDRFIGKTEMKWMTLSLRAAGSIGGSGIKAREAKRTGTPSKLIYCTPGPIGNTTCRYWGYSRCIQHPDGYGYCG